MRFAVGFCLSGRINCSGFIVYAANQDRHPVKRMPGRDDELFESQPITCELGKHTSIINEIIKAEYFTQEISPITPEEFTDGEIITADLSFPGSSFSNILDVTSVR